MVSKIIDYFKSFFRDFKNLFTPMSKNPKDYINFAKKHWINVLSVFLIAIVVQKNNNNTSDTSDNINLEASEFIDIVGYYSGTSQMGYSSGTASIEIAYERSAVLTYEQYGYGGAT